MESDKRPLPEGANKEEADQSEILAAELKKSKQSNRRSKRSAAANCAVYWGSPHQICGAIKEKYESAGIFSLVGRPTSGMILNPDGIGMRAHFELATIYWHPDTGAHIVRNPAMEAWGREGWEAGTMGYPTSDDFPTGINANRRQNFQRGILIGGIPSGIHSVRGKILEAYEANGADGGILGAPVTDEAGTPDGIGRFNRFQFGMIYWHPNYGAHPITGIPLWIWSEAGYENSHWGYPTSSHEVHPTLNTTQQFSKSDFDLEKIYLESGFEDFNGHFIPTILARFLRGQNVFSTEVSASQVRRTPRAANPNPVPVPYNYIYNPRLDPKSLHDYCTLSPDSVELFGKDIDFSGPCANHDICYEDAPHYPPAQIINPILKDSKIAHLGPRRTCDKKLSRDLFSVCTANASGSNDVSVCIGIAQGYYLPVVETHECLAREAGIPGTKYVSDSLCLTLNSKDRLVGFGKTMLKIVKG